MSANIFTQHIVISALQARYTIEYVQQLFKKKKKKNRASNFRLDENIIKY